MEQFLYITLVILLMAVTGAYTFSVHGLLQYLREKHVEKWQALGSPIPFSWYGPAKAIRVIKFIFAQNNLGDSKLAKKSKRAKILFILLSSL